MVSHVGQMLNFYFSVSGYKHRMVKAIKAGERFRSDPTAKQRKDHSIVQSSVQGRDVFTLYPKAMGEVDNPDRVLIFFHGGAYFYDIMDIHIKGHCALSSAAGVPVVLPSYPLAPYATPAQITDFAQAVFEQTRALYPNAKIIIGGDSAGGGLAVQLAVQRAGEGIAALILWSPWVDVSCTNPALVDADKRSVIIGIDGVRLGGQIYAGREDLNSPALSPLYADLSSLPPTHIWTGTRDLLYPDIVQFAHKAKAQGVTVTVTEGPGQNHMWMYMPQPEAKAVRTQTAAAILGA